MGNRVVEVFPCVLGELGQVHREAGAASLGSLRQDALYAWGGGGARFEVRFPVGLYLQAAGAVGAAQRFGAIVGAATGLMSTVGTVSTGVAGQISAGGGWSW